MESRRIRQKHTAPPPASGPGQSHPESKAVFIHNQSRNDQNIFRGSRGNKAHYFRFAIYDLREVRELQKDS
jgi:hypothetical protein